MSSLKIILATLCWFIAFGILNILTIRICVEYFTIFTPTLSSSDLQSSHWRGIRSCGMGLAQAYCGVYLRVCRRIRLRVELKLLFGHPFVTCLAFCIALIAGIIDMGLRLSYYSCCDWFQGIPRPRSTSRWTLWKRIGCCALLLPVRVRDLAMSSKGRSGYV